MEKIKKHKGIILWVVAVIACILIAIPVIDYNFNHKKMTSCQSNKYIDTIGQRMLKAGIEDLQIVSKFKLRDEAGVNNSVPEDAKVCVVTFAGKKNKLDHNLTIKYAIFKEEGKYNYVPISTN